MFCYLISVGPIIMFCVISGGPITVVSVPNVASSSLQLQRLDVLSYTIWFVVGIIPLIRGQLMNTLYKET